MKPTLNWAIERPHVRDQSEKRGILTATRLYTVTNMLLYRNLLASFYPLKAEFNFLAIQAVFPLIFFLFRPCFLWFSFYSGRVPYDFLSIFRPFSQWFSCYSGRVSSDFLAIQAVFPLIFFLFRPCALRFSFYSGRVSSDFLSIQAVFPMMVWTHRHCSNSFLRARGWLGILVFHVTCKCGSLLLSRVLNDDSAPLTFDSASCPSSNLIQIDGIEFNYSYAQDENDYLTKLSSFLHKIMKRITIYTYRQTVKMTNLAFSLKA